jgi:drug/metabolite transporter (DMT)-like permease
VLDQAQRDRLGADRHAADHDDGLTAVLFAGVSAVLFGLMSVTVRMGLAAGASAEAGSFVTALTALAVTIVTAAAAVAAGGASNAAALWPFVLAGVLAPGLSQLFFFRAVRDAGASRTSVIVGTAPLVAVVIALIALDEPARPLLLLGGILIVGGSIALGLEPERPIGFKRAGVVFALLTTVMFATRDDLLRWLATDSPPPALPAAAVAMAGGATTLTVFLLARRRLTRAAVAASARRFVLPGLLFGASYAFLFEAYYRGRVAVVSPLVATESLFGVLFAVLLLRRSELVGRHVIVGAALVVAGAAIIGATR